MLSTNVLLLIFGSLLIYYLLNKKVIENLEYKSHYDNSNDKQCLNAYNLSTIGYRSFSDTSPQNFCPCNDNNCAQKSYKKIGLDGVNGQRCYYQDGKVTCNEYYGIYDRDRTLCEPERYQF